ncbi:MULTISPECIES: molybdate ABC transporter permease subunit [unclassified Vibrio]|uniref:Molybdenum transport system permease n=1 Tax=Vibrio sp. HB236076 TaxID=3232307 RepID=A0AB39HKI8_9VIBR|nr:molybdate ABC transporter permease subunit [Vibrio sp. HB161653]MDP5252611.1 molybdate ABC transporter permease subunit [Vibrio sp. HB161653]
MISDYEWAAIILSLKVACIAVLVSAPFAIVCAWVLAKKEFKAKALLDCFIHLPLVLPPVVIGYLLLVVMGRQGIIGQWLYEWFGLTFSFSWRGAALAAAVVSFPLMVRSIRQSLEAIDHRLEQAARTMGASSLATFFRVTLPLSLPGLLSGVVLAFSRSLGEFGATITFAANIPGETRTLPLAMYTFIETPGAEYEAMRLCLFSILIALLSLLVSQWLSQRIHR